MARWMYKQRWRRWKTRSCEMDEDSVRADRHLYRPESDDVGEHVLSPYRRKLHLQDLFRGNQRTWRTWRWSLGCVISSIRKATRICDLVYGHRRMASVVRESPCEVHG